MLPVADTVLPALSAKFDPDAIVMLMLATKSSMKAGKFCDATPYVVTVNVHPEVVAETTVWAFGSLLLVTVMPDTIVDGVRGVLQGLKVPMICPSALMLIPPSTILAALNAGSAKSTNANSSFNVRTPKPEPSAGSLGQAVQSRYLQIDTMILPHLKTLQGTRMPRQA